MSQLKLGKHNGPTRQYLRSFLTIGYGDITPVGLARFLAVLEGIAGVTLMSSFVVALTRKYVD